MRLDGDEGGSSLFHALIIRIFASFFLKPCAPASGPGRGPLLSAPRAPRLRTFRAFANQSLWSSSSCSSSSRARRSIRARSLLRARLPTFIGAFAPQPSPKVSSFSQSRGARARTGRVAASKKGPESMFHRPKADGASGVSCGRGSSWQSCGGRQRPNYFVSDRGGISMRYLSNIRHRGVRCFRNCSTTRRLQCSPPHPGREQVVVLIPEAGE